MAVNHEASPFWISLEEPALKQKIVSRSRDWEQRTSTPRGARGRNKRFGTLRQSTHGRINFGFWIPSVPYLPPQKASSCRQEPRVLCPAGAHSCRRSGASRALQAPGTGWAPGTRCHITAAQHKAVQRGQRLSPKIVPLSLRLSYPLLLLLPSNSILFGVQDGKWSVLALVPVWCGDLAL